MVRFSEIHRAAFRRLKRLKIFRWLFVSNIYRKPIAQSELTLRYLRNKANLDFTYWTGKLRQFAHVVDKGISRGDFSTGHGNSGYLSTKKALLHIDCKKHSSDPTVIWAKQIVQEYDSFQSGKLVREVVDIQESKCSTENLIDTICSRRSIRNFTKRNVEISVIDKVASVLDWAPSSCHRQPGVIYATNSPKVAKTCSNLHVGAGCFSNMHLPLFMVFCADSRLYTMPNELSTPFIDVSLGVQNCLLTAHSLGLSLTPLIWSHQTEWQETELRSIFSIPDYYQIILSVVGGYPKVGTNIPPRKLKELHIIQRSNNG